MDALNDQKLFKNVNMLKERFKKINIDIFCFRIASARKTLLLPYMLLERMQSESSIF